MAGIIIVVLIFICIKQYAKIQRLEDDICLYKRQIKFYVKRIQLIIGATCDGIWDRESDKKYNDFWDNLNKNKRGR